MSNRSPNDLDSNCSQDRLGLRWAAVIATALLLAACGGGESSQLDPEIQAGNAEQIRKEFADLGSRNAASASGTSADAVDKGPAATGTDMNGHAQATGATAVAATGGAPIADGELAQAGTGTLTETPGHDFAAAALAAVNAARAQPRQCGDKSFPAVGPLTWDARVAYAALLESEWMLNSNSFGHAWPNGELVWDRLTMAGYDWQLGDENIAAGFRNLADAMQAWIDSPPHCVALMRADIQQVGIAVVPGAEHSKFLSYWTMALGTPRKRL